jgi:RHS repeat-associated protein
MWADHTNRASNAPYTIYHAGGSTTVQVDQHVNGGIWNYLGTFTMSPGQNHRVELTDQANGRVIADAINITRAGALPPTATWAPSFIQRDNYDVFARWTANSYRATDVPYSVVSESGSTTIAKNQQTNGGSWQLLGTFTMAPGQGHRVDMTDVTSNGTYIIADATRYLPKVETKVANWPISVGSTGNYKVYAKWPASAAHATNAVYTVSHANGSSGVIVNQRLNGGVWNLLGTFAFNSGGGGYKVELSDAASGKVAADAIYYVKDAPPSGETFAWEPAIPSSGVYTVYARWPASSLNSSAASYAIVHAGGTATVVANQRLNGGSWKYLGSFEFAPNAGHKVILQASADGDTIADAVRLVGSAPAPANVAYIHSDHLGTPQKMTDASKVVTWDRVQDPFGNTHSLAGASLNPLRFPGQYADEESALAYNYFRDYDPTLGRYVQSDPIGLLGAMSTYAYVSGRPVLLTDMLGLTEEDVGFVQSQLTDQFPELDPDTDLDFEQMPPGVGGFTSSITGEITI